MFNFSIQSWVPSKHKTKTFIFWKTWTNVYERTCQVSSLDVHTAAVFWRRRRRRRRTGRSRRTGTHFLVSQNAKLLHVFSYHVASEDPICKLWQSDPQFGRDVIGWAICEAIHFYTKSSKHFQNDILHRWC